MEIDSDEFLDWLETLPCDQCGEKHLELIFLPHLEQHSTNNSFGYSPKINYSLAGMMTKFSAKEVQWPYLVCECGRVCQGKQD
jgi:hypothetical protein